MEEIIGSVKCPYIVRKLKNKAPEFCTENAQLVRIAPGEYRCTCANNPPHVFRGGESFRSTLAPVT